MPVPGVGTSAGQFRTDVKRVRHEHAHANDTLPQLHVGDSLCDLKQRVLDEVAGSKGSLLPLVSGPLNLADLFGCPGRPVGIALDFPRHHRKSLVCLAHQSLSRCLL